MAEDNKKKVILGGIFLGLIPLLFLLYLILAPLLSLMSKDLKATEMYVISDGVNVRVKPETKALKMGRITYGTKLKVYNIQDHWAEVLIEDQGTGYVSSDYIAKPETFYMLEGLFGDDLSKRMLKKTKYRLAVLRYIEEKGYITKIPKEYKEEFDDEELDRETYQIFSEPSKYYYNSVAYGNFNGDHTDDVAVVLKNTDTDQNLLVIITFDKNDPMNKSKAIYEQELEEPWFYIHRAIRGKYFYLNDKVQEALNEGKKPYRSKIKIDGILIGSNRNKDLEDPVNLLLYNGETFEIHPQDIKTE